MTEEAARQIRRPGITILLTFFWGILLFLALTLSRFGTYAPFAAGAILVIGVGITIALIYSLVGSREIPTNDSAPPPGSRLCLTETDIELDTILTPPIEIRFESVRKVENIVDPNRHLSFIRIEVDRGSFEIWGFESMDEIRDLLLERVPETAEVSEIVRFPGTLAAVPWQVRTHWVAAGAAIVFVAFFVIAQYQWPVLVLVSIPAAALIAVRIGMLPYYWKNRGLFGMTPFYRSLRYTVYLLVVLAVAWFLWPE